LEKRDEKWPKTAKMGGELSPNWYIVGINGWYHRVAEEFWRALVTISKHVTDFETGKITGKVPEK